MLDWPEEAVCDADGRIGWQHPGSNICLDFHGDPTEAGVVILSDGNHHMALNQVVRTYADRMPDRRAPFYATFPPSVVSTLVREGKLRLGNLVLSISPEVLLGPPQFFRGLENEKAVVSTKPFMRGRGCALLIAKGNPKKIVDVADLCRSDIGFFLSNPDKEKVSHQGYVDALHRAADIKGIGTGFLDPASERITYGDCIHHREAPEAVASQLVDVAILYHHLALRYCRIFPNRFDMLPLISDGEGQEKMSRAERSLILAGLLRDAGPDATAFYDFLDSPEVTDIYAYHGLDRTE